MRYPRYPTHEQQQRQDRLDDLARTLAMLRRAVREGGRIDVEIFCDCFLRRLSIAPLPDDDCDEVAAVILLLRRRTTHGLNPRLRTLLLPLVAAVESQMETASTKY